MVGAIVAERWIFSPGRCLSACSGYYRPQFRLQFDGVSTGNSERLAPYVELRGVSASQYQGNRVLAVTVPTGSGSGVIAAGLPVVS